MHPEDLQTLVSMKMPYGKYAGSYWSGRPGDFSTRPPSDPDVRD